MDRKKKRGKHSGGTASEAESIAGQPEDVHLRQREAVSAKKGAVGCGPNSDSPSQASLTSMPWSYTQHLLAHHIFQHPAHAAMPQPPTQTQQPATAQRGQQGGTQQPSPPGQPSQVPELSGQSTGVGCNPFHPASADSNHDGAHNLSGTTAPHNIPGGFVFPPPPYPGQWDPLSLWMHQVHQQAFYPYSFLGNRGGYPYPNPATSVQTNQRGFIKAPPSLSQKHHRLWEMQSTENMQLWATTMQLWASIARAEAEISCQRGKILKLEANLQTMKAHQDALLEASKGADVPQPVRRGRAKRTATAPVAIVGLPASQPSAARTPFRKARGKISKVDLAKNIKEVDSEKLKSTLVDNIPGVIDGSSQDQQVQKSSPTVGLNGSESGPNTNSHKDVVGSQQAVNHRLYEEIANVSSRHDSQNSPSRPHLPVKESYGQQNMETKEACIASFLKSEANRAKQAVVSGDCSIKSELMGMSRRDDWSEANGNDLARNALLGGLLHEQYNSSSLGTSNAISLAKVVPDWHYAEDGSGEQEDAVASGQGEEEAEDNVETTLDAIGGGKTSNYFVLNPEAAISKELTALGRWRV